MEIKVIPSEQTPKVDLLLNDDVPSYIEEHREKLLEFLEYAKTRNDAVGLAANQVSIDGERFNVRAFALRNIKTNEWSLIINPFITKYVGIKETKHEGCLTWKTNTNLVIVAERYRGVLVTYYDMGGNDYEDTLHKGFEGQIWQHEINHLNGVEEKVESEIFLPTPKVISSGRNQPCPCGSGLKYKKCCLLLL